MPAKAPLSKHRAYGLLVCAKYDDQLDENEKQTMASMADLSSTLPEESFRSMMGSTCESLAKDHLAKIQTHARIENSTRIIDGIMKDDHRKKGNHLLHDLWLPWARKAQFVSRIDCHLLASDDGAQSESLRHGQIKTSWSIPTASVLRYMVEHAPSRKIIELGAGRGYWTKLLRKFGGQVTAVDDTSENMSRPLIRDLIKMDAIRYLRQAKADDTALFFCWPRQKNDGGRWVESCLREFNGGTVYYVGVLEGGCTFEIDEWLKHIGESLGWRIVYKAVLPGFCGVPDEFVHLKRN